MVSLQLVLDRWRRNGCIFELSKCLMYIYIESGGWMYHGGCAGCKDRWADGLRELDGDYMNEWVGNL